MRARACLRVSRCTDASMQLGFSAFKLSARCGGTLRQRERESRDRGRKRERDRERERERERETSLSGTRADVH